MLRLLMLFATYLRARQRVARWLYAAIRLIRHDAPFRHAAAIDTLFSLIRFIDAAATMLADTPRAAGCHFQRRAMPADFQLI